MLRVSSFAFGQWHPESMRLANIDVAPAHRNAFTRAIANHILWLPAKCHFIALLVVLMIAGPAIGMSTSIIFLAGGAALFVCDAMAKRRLIHRVARHHYRELEHLKQLGLLSGIFWGVVMATALTATGQSHLAELILMTTFMMLLACVKFISSPHIGMVHIVTIFLGSCIGLFHVGTASAIMSAAVLSALTVALYAAIYNLFYSFATRRLRTRALQETNETVQVLLREFDEQGSDWLWEVDSDGRILTPSPRFAEAAGTEPAALTRNRLTMLFDTSQETDALAAILKTPRPFRRTIVSLNVAGKPRWWSLSGRPNVNKAGEVIGMRGVATDVTASKEAEAKIAYMAHYDNLTDLPNRVLFNQTLQRSLKRKQPGQLVSVLYLDLDRFKMINDSMGHDVGDFVLKTMASRISACIGTNDMAARFGGDEFAVLITSIAKREDIVKLAIAIIDSLAEPIFLDGQHINSGTSIGIAFDDDTNIDEVENAAQDLLKYADLALYDAKSRGGHVALVFLPKMYEAMLTRRSIEADLSSAILQNELELYYQPLVNIETSSIVAYEALLRWNHPTRGQIQPAIFIPIAEETGLIVQIGEWVIRNALREVATWPDHLSVSLNLSPVQMRSPNIIPTLVNALATSCVAPERVEIEITESVLMHDSEANLALLHRLKAIGLRISLDDFGTGYSSLNYLRSFPFDKIKIDRCFVEGITDRADCQAIIHAVLSLASSLNMTTTAEGIENSAQLLRLKEDGCNQAQGYFFSRPAPAHTLEHKATSNVLHYPIEIAPKDKRAA